ncbi:MAG: FAD binding domain-containing protein [Thermogemmatispora sp.]|uniref:FAD binding domain-containing protein n=1 Tax=Thermogemmatispora sp. TaxID=1968838 RepID=UPI00262AC63E|nr:FAD binding domain-containing protein [Thermogemmatispora sp.]MBX5455926.1 FAD binding domain-containing protein [Thermogemmatispora sp.]
MLPNLLEYHWVEDVDDALILLSRPDIKTVPLAGGTYLLGQNEESIQAVVDLRDLGLAYISEDQRGIRIGSMTTLQSMAEAPLLKSFLGGLLAQAAQYSAPSPLIRNAATLGGTLALGASAQADLLTALAVVDAEVVLRSGQKTQVDLRGGTPERPGLALSGVTYKGKQERRVPYHRLLLERRPQELIIEVQIAPPGRGWGTALERVGRSAVDTALLTAAALVEVENGRYRNVRLALGGVNMEPQRLPTLERRLEGQPVQDLRLLATAVQAGLADFRPPADFRASPGYRRVCGANLAYRALEEAANIARWRDITSSEGRA